MDTLPSERVLFGAFELDLTTGELRSTETPDPSQKVLLREQVFRVLRMLLEREGKIVTREEIKRKLWPADTVVDFDCSINATIKTLRRALGDSADNARYIETLARRGYRLMPAVAHLESAPATALEKDREQREQSAPVMSENAARVQRQVMPHWWKAALVLASAVILVGAGYMSWRHLLPHLQPKISGYPTVVLIHSPIALAPVVELTGSHAQPSDESSDADLALLRPAPDEIHHLIPHIMRHPGPGQSSPRLFFNAMWSAISSARTSSLVCTFFSKNSIRFCFSSTWRWGRSGVWKADAPFSKNSFCQR